jgi:glutamate racemase
MESFSIVETIAGDKSSPFYIDFSQYPADKSDLPIGIFDSGSGGLTVLNAILKLDKFNNLDHSKGADGTPDFESEKFIFLADSANMPYGRYDAESKSEFLRELIIKNVGFLLGSRYDAYPGQTASRTGKEPVKAVVIACNTATAYGLEMARRCVESWELDIPVIGIIESGAQEAAERINPKIKKSLVGVFATQGTVASQGYSRVLTGQFTAKGLEKAAVIQQAGFGLAGAVDGDSAYIDPDADQIRGDKYQGPRLDHPEYPVLPELWEAYHFDPEGLLLKKEPAGKLVAVELNSVINYIRYYVTHMAENSRRRFPDHTLQVIVLGCTHYPFFKEEFQRHFQYLRRFNINYGNVIAENLHVVDPAESEAEALFQYLRQTKRFGNSSNDESRFFISVPNPLLLQNQLDAQGRFTLEYKYGRDINQEVEYVKRVPLSLDRLPAEAAKRIRLQMPVIYGYITREN